MGRWSQNATPPGRRTNRARLTPATPRTRPPRSATLPCATRSDCLWEPAAGGKSPPTAGIEPYPGGSPQSSSPLHEYDRQNRSCHHPGGVVADVARLRQTQQTARGPRHCADAVDRPVYDANVPHAPKHLPRAVNHGAHNGSVIKLVDEVFVINPAVWTAEHPHECIRQSR